MRKFLKKALIIKKSLVIKRIFRYRSIEIKTKSQAAIGRNKYEQKTDNLHDIFDKFRSSKWFK